MTNRPGNQQPRGSQQQLSAGLLPDAENMELQGAMKKTNISNSQSEEDAVVEEYSGDNAELEQGNLEITSKGPEEAVSPRGEKGNFQKSGPQKRKASERKENILISHQKQHQMLLTTIGCGLSQLIEDEETPETMRGPLKVLKHYTKFEDKDAAPPKKIIKVEKQDQEYFEYDDTKREPMESEESAQVPEQQNDT